MALDAVCLQAVVRELAGQILGAKVVKIHQPQRDVVQIALRGEGGTMRLLLRASANAPRIQLTGAASENPAEPPMFCMLLRKHLTGGRITNLSQPPLERLVELTFQVTDELGTPGVRRLVLELMGRNANLILLDMDGRIVDCLRKVNPDLSASRQVLPGLFYRLPPAQQDKWSLLETTPDTRRTLLRDAPTGKRAADWLLSAFQGLSPLLCRELAFRAGADGDIPLGLLDQAAKDALLNQLTQLIETIKWNNFTPYILIRAGRPMDFSAIPILQYGAAAEGREMASFSQLLDAFYTVRERTDRMGQKSQELRKTVTLARERTARRIALQTEDRKKARDRETMKRFGDILTANLHVMEKGASRLCAVDFYDPEGKEIEISLQIRLSPQENAARYYKEYHKAKRAESWLGEQLEKGRQELEYLESVLETLSRAEGDGDLEEIRRELLEAGYFPGKKAERQKKPPRAQPLEFHSTAGLCISVGKNHLQNEQLLKAASKNDLWFHTQKIHGSHVILWTEGSPPDQQSVEEAAALAAHYSQAGQGQNVPVDYTQVKYVKKPGGARPGMVIYQRYRTLYVTPEPALAERLRVR